MSKRKTDTSSGPPAAARLRFDPDAVLVKCSSQLAAPRFVGALHEELGAELGVQEAALALLQIGCLHGLRDALRAAAASGGTLAGEAGAPISPPLPMRFRTRPATRGDGIEVHGSWPERGEASARLATLGARPDPSCFLSAGYTSGWLSGTFNAELLALETHCSGSGAPDCHFVARESAAWRAAGDPHAVEILDALPFATLRKLALAELEKEPAAEPAGAFDPNAAVVHIWGPVMVIPFGGSDEAMRAVELIGRDAGARDVSVVVLDLTGAIVDEAFGAVALEQIVETIELWGAEAIFAGVTPLSQRVIDDLESQPLMAHKDVDSAVAAAFRIAQSQRRLV